MRENEPRETGTIGHCLEGVEKTLEELRVLLVDDNAEMRHAIREQISKQEGMKVVGECANGLEALETLGKTAVDAMVLDIIMPQMDGYTLMEEMRRQQMENAPQIIVTTALGRDDFIMRAVELGAKYYMVKPFEIQTLVARIREVAGHVGPQQEIVHLGSLQRSQTLDEKLSSLFLTIGIPAHIKGYQFLREAVKMVIETPDIINRITKELYPGIGRRFNTTASKVERAIRHAIEVAWSRGRIDTLNRAFGCKVASKEDKPTNGEFIAMIADKLAMEQRSA